MKRSVHLTALRAAFPATVPILAGFLFLGMTYGILMNASGFSAWYPFCTSLFIFAGSMEFVTANLLQAAFHPLQAFLLTLMINARHLFYGISMLERYRNIPGLRRIYMIFGLCDESFSINYAASVPPDVDRNRFMFYVTLLNQSYWVAGATLGGVFGSLIRFDTAGLDFAMTAMFVVILLEQVMKRENRLSAAIGIGCSVLCLVLFGAGDFLIPAMLLIVACLSFAGRARGGDGA